MAGHGRGQFGLLGKQIIQGRQVAFGDVLFKQISIHVISILPKNLKT
jgi:hypothetical protein